MNDASRHYIWALNAPTLLLYVAAAAIFIAIQAANLRLMETLAGGVKPRKLRDAAGALLLALASNFVGAAAIALLARLSNVPSRQSLILFPLVLLAERHARLGLTSPKSRSAHVWGFLGAAAGMLSGAWMFLKSDFAQDTVARVAVPGDVATLPLSDVMQNPGDWAISIQLVVFYCVSLAIFSGAHELLKRAFPPPTAAQLKDRPPYATAALSALALNFCGVALLTLLGRTAGVQIRLAMVLVPLLVVMEYYVKEIRSDAANRKSYFAGLAGSAGGIVSAAFLMLRGAPIQ